jgi:uncharacterized membrane protein YeaQ/YmgE (transglycosylase-associated protein family)
MIGFIVWIVVGAVAGWLAGLVVRGGGFGFLVNAVLGIVGAAVAGFVLPRLGFYLGGGLVGEILRSAIGAVIVLVILSIVPKLQR